jgi:RND family efflux transporter MFP subunit
METNLAQAKSSVEIARNNLDKCFMRAPSDGIIGRRNIEPGMLPLTLGSAPFELVEINMVNVKISVPENEVNKIKKGMKATISVAAMNGAIYEGIVTNISPVAELMSRTYNLKITVNNTRLELKPGMVCDVTIPSGAGTPALVVPYQAVGKDTDGKNFVFLVNPGQETVKKQLVSIGKYNGAGIEITGGLTEGQLIVVRGIEKLSDNSLIKR